MTAEATLETSLRRVHAYYLESLTSDHSARTFARDWPANNRALASALVRCGGPVAWLDRDPAGPVDDTPFMIASLDEATGHVRFDPATADQCRGVRAAHQYDWRGDHLEAEEEEG